MKDRPGYEILSLGVTEDSVPAALALVISLVDLHVVLECQERELFALCLEQIYGSLLPACGRPGFHTSFRHASHTRRFSRPAHAICTRLTLALHVWHYHYPLFSHSDCIRVSRFSPALQL